MKTTKMLMILVLVLVVGLTAEVANADFTFGEPTNLGPTVNGPDDMLGVSISYDRLELYFCSNRPGGYGGYDLWVTTRDTIDDEWGTPMNLGPNVNSQYDCMAPSISADGLTLYFSDYDYSQSHLPGGFGSTDTWMVTRRMVHAPWSSPANVGRPVNFNGGDICPNISADGLALYFACGGSRGGSGLYDLWVATRTTTDNEWGAPKELRPSVNSPAVDACPSISSSGLVLFFCSDRTGGQGDYDLWMTSRSAKEHSWRPSVNLGPVVNSSALDGFPSISADGSTLYFCSARLNVGGFGQGDLWQAPIIPIVDFNGDGIVDIDDLVILIEHWGQDQPSVDIGPTPFGDGIVDVQDLDVLMSYWGQEFEFLPFDLLAYWKLDEAEGVIAQDSIGENNGAFHGEPLWQPTGGRIDGALEFDGIDDYVSTPFVLNPADGAFSVFVWIKDGAPGQVVISQADGADWLFADPSEGKLMTKLSRPPGGRTEPTPLVSEFVISDGSWHHIGFVWDGSNRILYADDVEVAKDTQADLASSEDGLYIGAGKDLDTASFLSGLIDDVRIRIYNLAITEFATQPNPANGAKGMPVDATLSWTPADTAATHDVYFGTSSPPAFIGNQAENSYDPGPLELSTTYYWQIDEIEADGTTKHTGAIWSFTTAATTGVKKGAYLIYPGDNTQMTVLWQLDATHDCTLEWGTDTNYGSSVTSSEYGSDHQHQYTITSLTPGAKYYYRVQVEAGYLTGSFLAAPAADAQNVKFLAYGDTRSRPQIHDAVNAQMIAAYTSDPAYQTFTMLTGDWVADGDTESDWTDQFFSRSWPNTMEMQANLPINGCIGNHEESGTIFEKYWPYPYESGGQYWSFDYGPAHIVVLDQYTTSYAPGSPQYMWLENDLANATAPWKFIQLHAPGWSAGRHGNNSAVQNDIQPLCETYGIAIVFAGHNHYYARAMVEGVAHITTGGGGAPLYPPEDGHPNIVAYDQSNHFCRINIQGRQLTFETVRMDGTVIDTFTMSH